jgi:hypothetical protein
MLSNGCETLGREQPLGSYSSHSFSVFLVLGDMGSQGPKGKYSIDILP